MIWLFQLPCICNTQKHLKFHWHHELLPLPMCLMPSVPAVAAGNRGKKKRVYDCIRSGSGKDFYPERVQAFLEITDVLCAIQEKFQTKA